MCCKREKEFNELDFLNSIEEALKDTISSMEDEGVDINTLPKKKQIKIYKALVGTMSADITECVESKNKLLDEINSLEDIIDEQRSKIRELEAVIDEQNAYTCSLEDENFELVSRCKEIAEILDKAY